jgi:hypothetical protein
MGAGHDAPVRQPRGRRRRTGVALIALVALVVVGCSGDDDADTEVGGAVLERDEDGQPTGPSDPDDERVDPRDADGAADDADDGDDGGDGGDGAAGTGTGSTSEQNREPDAASDGSAGTSAGSTPATPGEGGSTPGTTSGTTTPPTSASPSPSAPAPSRPGPDRGEEPPTTEGPRTERRTVDNPYRPPAPPPPDPEPVDLPAGRGLTGTSVFFGTDDVELGGGAAAVQGAALRSDASHRDARLSCETNVYAPSDRRLRVRGEIEVRIQHEDRNGVVTELRRQAMRVDVTVPADQSLRLPAATPWPFELATTRSLRCESIYRPW